MEKISSYRSFLFFPGCFFIGIWVDTVYWGTNILVKLCELRNQLVK